MVRQEWRKLGLAQHEGQLHGSDADHDRQQRCSHVRVIGIILVLLVRLVVRFKVVVEPYGGKGIAQGIYDENESNQEGKDFIREPGRKDNDTIEIRKGGNAHIDADPCSKDRKERMK